MKKPTREQVIQNAKQLAAQIEASIVALETEVDGTAMLDHVGFIRDQGRIEALRGVIRDRALELFARRG